MLSESSGAATMAGPARPRSLKQWLLDFNAAEGTLPQAFNRRRQRLLTVGSVFLIFNSLGWALFFALEGRHGLMAMDAALSLISALVLQLVRSRQLRLAGQLFLLSALLSVWGVSQWADIPTAAVPRTLHLYLVPLTAYSVFVLQHEHALLRGLVAAAMLASLCLLAMDPALPDAQHIMAVAQRRVGALINVVCASALLYATIDIMLRDARETSALELDFARAVAVGEIQAYLQAQCTADGRIVGAEALMRWRHSKRGYVSPAEFIPMAERSGLIVPAGEQIASIVCKALHGWEHDPVLRELTVSVNVSSAQLYSGASTSKLLGTVHQAETPPASLKFELTESMFVENFEAVRAKMEQIRSQGIRMALDDFGTGFSSLSYLKQLPLDQIKVDQSFVRDLPGDASAAKIAATIIHLGKDLGLEVVAEGVENREQLQALQDMGCRIFQGFLFSRPIPVEEFEALARSGKPLPTA